MREGNAVKLDFLKNEKIDFICTHPPYADIIQYSKNIEGDLSRLGTKEFLETMEKSCQRISSRIEKRKKLCGDDGRYQEQRKGHAIRVSYNGTLFKCWISVERNNYQRAA